MPIAGWRTGIQREVWVCILRILDLSCCMLLILAAFFSVPTPEVLAQGWCKVDMCHCTMRILTLNSPWVVLVQTSLLPGHLLCIPLAALQPRCVSFAVAQRRGKADRARTKSCDCGAIAAHRSLKWQGNHQLMHQTGDDDLLGCCYGCPFLVHLGLAPRYRSTPPSRMPSHITYAP